MGRTAVLALSQQLTRRKSEARAAPAIPGPELTAVVPPRPPALVRDYLRAVGGSPASYPNRLPPHLFPQWGFPFLARTLEGVPYPLGRVLNAGCRLEIHAPLPADEPLYLAARLDGIDDDGRRALIHSRLITGTPSALGALVAHLCAFVPLRRRDDGRHDDKARKERPQVPAGARELAWWRFGTDAGFTFACLTGDFNPLHWVPPAARAAGFRNVILHGFATLARALEGLIGGLWAGDASPLAEVDVRFTRPLVLPAEVGLYFLPASTTSHPASPGEARRGGEGSPQPAAFFVGDAPGGGAYLTGNFLTRGD